METPVNEPLSLRGQAFRALHLNLLFLINSLQMASVLADSWTTAWHEGIWAGGRAFTQFQATAVEQPSSAPTRTLQSSGDERSNSAARAVASPEPAALGPSCVSTASSAPVPGEEFDKTDWHCFVVGEAASLSLIHCRE